MRPSCLCGSAQTVHSKLIGMITLSALNTGCACLSPFLWLWTFPSPMPPHLPVPTQVIHTAEPSPEGSGQPKSIEICLLKHSLAAVNSPFTVAGFFRLLFPRAFCLLSHSVYRFCYIRKHFCSKTISDLLPQTYKDGRVRSLISSRLHPSSPCRAAPNTLGMIL